jgi:hypothetical protein
MAFLSVPTATPKPGFVGGVTVLTSRCPLKSRVTLLLLMVIAVPEATPKVRSLCRK